MQYLHVIILVSTAVKASSLCRAHHNELPSELLLPHEQESLFQISDVIWSLFFSIQREVQALHRGFRHLIFNLPYSVTRNFLFFFSPLQDLCWALSIHTINLITPHKCRHQPGKMKRCFRVKKKKKKLRFYFFDLPFYLPWDFYKQTVKSWKSNNGARMVLCCIQTHSSMSTRRQRYSLVPLKRIWWHRSSAALSGHVLAGLCWRQRPSKNVASRLKNKQTNKQANHTLKVSQGQTQKPKYLLLCVCVRTQCWGNVATLRLTWH